MPVAAGAKRKRAPAKGKAKGKAPKTSAATGKNRKTSVAPGPTRSELEGKGLAELRALCTAAKLSPTGGKDAIVRRLLEHHATVEIDSVSSASMSRSPSPSMGSRRADAGRLKVGPTGAVDLTPALLRDLGFIDHKLCALAEKCDNPRYAADALVGIIIFREGTGSIDLRMMRL